MGVAVGLFSGVQVGRAVVVSVGAGRMNVVAVADSVAVAVGVGVSVAIGDGGAVIVGVCVAVVEDGGAKAAPGLPRSPAEPGHGSDAATHCAGSSRLARSLLFPALAGTNSPTPHRRQAIRPASKEPDGLYQNCSDQQRRICKLLELCRWLQSLCCAPTQCMSPAAARHRRQSCAHCRWLIPVSNRANSLQRSLRCRFRPTRRCRR